MKIDRTDLLKALEHVKPGLAGKEVIEQTTSFAFLDDKIVTYNDEIAVTYPIQTGITGAVSANELYKLLKQTRKKQIEIKVGNELQIMGEYKAGIAFESDVSLPIDEIEQADDWKELPSDFTNAINFCLFTVSKDMNRPVFACVHATENYIEACDNFRYTRKYMEDDVDDSFLVLGNVARDLIKYNVKWYTKAGSWLHFKTEEDAVFSCRTYGEEYPDLSEQLDFEGTKITLPDASSEIVEKARIFKSGDQETDDKVQVTIDDGRLVIASESSSGWFKQSAVLEYEGDRLTFTIVPRFFLELLKLTHDIEVGDSVIKFEGDDFDHVVQMYSE